MVLVFLQHAEAWHFLRAVVNFMLYHTFSLSHTLKFGSYLAFFGFI